jgi:hypothetical protein
MHQPTLRLRPRTRYARLGARVALVVVPGLAIGVLTSLGQTYLSGALNAFVNSASAWLIAPFFVGSRMTSSRGAAAAGFAVWALQIVGYYATSELRGFSSGGAVLLFWTACALVGGPIFGGAGELWRTGTDRTRGLGAAVLAAAFLAEGAWVYVHELRYYDTAALWIGIGLVLALTMTHGLRERRWLALTVTVGLAGEVLLTQIYTQSF